MGSQLISKVANLGARSCLQQLSLRQNLFGVGGTGRRRLVEYHIRDWLLLRLRWIQSANPPPVMKLAVVLGTGWRRTGEDHLRSAGVIEVASWHYPCVCETNTRLKDNKRSGQMGPKKWQDHRCYAICGGDGSCRC